MKRDYKTQYGMMWHILTSKWTVFGYNSKKKEEYLQALLNLAYSDGRVDASLEIYHKLTK